MWLIGIGGGRAIFDTNKVYFVWSAGIDHGAGSVDVLAPLTLPSVWSVWNYHRPL